MKNHLKLTIKIFRFLIISLVILTGYNSRAIATSLDIGDSETKTSSADLGSNDTVTFTGNAPYHLINSSTGVFNVDSDATLNAINSNSSIIGQINIDRYSNLTVSGDVTAGQINLNSSSSIVNISGQLNVDSIVNNGGTLTIAGGTVTSINNSVYNDGFGSSWGGELNINGNLSVSGNFDNNGDNIARPVIVIGENVNRVSVSGSLNSNFGLIKAYGADRTVLLAAGGINLRNTTLETGDTALIDASNATLSQGTDSGYDALILSGGKLKNAGPSTYQVDSTSQQVINIIYNLNPPSGSAMSDVKTQLFALPTAQQVKTATNSLELPKNSMTQQASMSVVDKTNNVVSSHIAQNNMNFDGLSGFASGNSLAYVPYGLWGQFFGGSALQDQRDGQSGYKSNIGGFVLGADTFLESEKANHTFGLAFSYSSTSVDSQDVDQSNDIGSYQLALYNNNIAKDGLGLYGEHIINIARNQYNSTRTLFTGPQARAKYYGTQYGMKNGVGYNFKLYDNLLLTPKASVRYSRLDQQGYNEQGAGNAGLAVSSSDFETFLSEIGVKSVYKARIKSLVILPELEGSWIRNWKTKGQTTTSSFIAGGGEFTNASASLVANIFDIGIGVTIPNFKKTGNSLSFRYDRQQAASYSSDIGYIKYRIEF